MGGDKNLKICHFIGSINNLASITLAKDEFEQIKNGNSNALIIINFRKSIEESNYFENINDNGFMGLINGSSIKNDENDLSIEEIRANNNYYYSDVIFKNYNSYLNLSNQIIEYISKKNYKSYGFFMSYSLIYNNFFNICNNNRFYYYRLNNFNVYLEFSNYDYINNIIELNIYCNDLKKNSIQINNNSFGFFYLKFIYNYNNNFNIKFEILYNFSNSFSSISESKNNININLSNINNHQVGFLENNTLTCNSNKINKFNIKIFEIIFFEGAAHFIDLNNDLFLLNNNQKILITYRVGGFKFPLSRVDNYNDGVQINYKNFSFQKPNCIIVKNNICLKCIKNYSLNNNNDCIYDIFNKNNDLILKWNCKNIPTELNYISQIIINNTYFTFNLNNKIYYLFILYNTELLYINTDFEFQLNGTPLSIKYKKGNNINEFFYTYKEKINNSNYNLQITNNLNINFKLSFQLCDYRNYSYFILNENCNDLTGQNNFFPILSEFGLFKCIDINNKEDNYYLSKEKLLIKCNSNCENCISFNQCIKCKNNYFLLDYNCYKNENDSCEIANSFDTCTKCRINKPKYQLNNNTFTCFKNCSNNCLTCLSPVYNKCTSCDSSYLYYPDLMKCFQQNICDTNYDFIDDNKICYNICKKMNLNNICISCIKNYNLRISDNKCIKCNQNNGMFLNFNHLDSVGKPYCYFCDSECETCIEEKKNCLSCNINKKFLKVNNECVDECPLYFYESNNICLNCNDFCINCSTSNKCNECIYGYYTLNDKCVEKCPNNYFPKNNNCLICSSFINNCTVCDDEFQCLECEFNYFLKDNKCIKCNDIGFYKKSGKCLKCNSNCLNCEDESYNCISCKDGLILKNINNYNICIKNCNNNNFFDLKNNKCLSCNNCNYCYKNNHLNCFNCDKCKQKCKLNFKYNNEGLLINTNSIEEIKLNTDFLINNLPKNKMVLKQNSIFYKFYEHLLIKLNLNINIGIINGSKNCYDLNYNNIILYRDKLDCKIISIKTFKNNTIKINNNFLLKNNFLINLKVDKTDFNLKNNIIHYNKINKLESELFLNITNNYFKNNINIKLFIDQNYLIKQSYCIINNINKSFFINLKINKKYESELLKNVNNLTQIDENFLNIKNIENISKNFQNTKKYSFTIFLFFASVTGLINFLSKVFQLIYFIEILNLIPIDYGSTINTFLKYFSINLNTDIDLNKLFLINNNYLKSFYFNKFLVNPKLYDIEWWDITLISLESLFIVLLYIIKIFYKILNSYFYLEDKKAYEFVRYKNILDKNKNKKKINIVVCTKKNFKKKQKNKKIDFENEVNLIIFSLIEGLKINYFAILIIYSYSLVNFQLSLDYFKIFVLFIFNFLLLSKYFWDLINALFFRNYKKYKTKYYKSILLYSLKEKFFNLFHQLITTFRDFFIVFIILSINYKYNVHLILICIIQFIYIIYLFFIRLRKNQKNIILLRIEEIFNLLLIISLLINHHIFENYILQYLFIIVYILLFSFKFGDMIYNFWKYIYGLILILKKKILKKFKKKVKKK